MFPGKHLRLYIRPHSYDINVIGGPFTSGCGTPIDEALADLRGKICAMT